MTAGSFQESTATTAQHSDATVPPVTFDIYPFDTPKATLAENYRHTKHLHLIRHAQGTHNVNQEYRDIKNMDARLTDLGVEQCRNMAKKIESGQHAAVLEADLIVTSPMTRCIQTTLLTMEPLIARGTTNLLVHENVRETVNFNCDRRRAISEIQPEFDLLDFTHTHADHDAIWQHYEERLGSYEEYTYHRESAEIHKVAERARQFFQWLAQRDEERVVVCSHAAFLRCLCNFGLHDAIPKQMLQTLDDRGSDAKDIPVFRYCGGDEAFITAMQDRFENCELRSVVIAFDPK